MVGIYKVTNQINGKIYIGQSQNIANRWRKHKTEPFNSNSSSYNSHFYQAIRKYGIDNFTFEVLEECSKEELDKKERLYIAQYNSYEQGYNSTQGGQDTFVVAQQKLSNQVVLEIIEKLKNLSLSEQEIADMYGISQRMVSGINLGQTRIQPNVSYPIRAKMITKKYHCIKCGAEISNSKAQYCMKCSRMMARKVERPDRETLKSLIRKESFLSIGRTYGVTDNAIRKWCKNYNLPVKKQDIKKISDEDWSKI